MKYKDSIKAEGKRGTCYLRKKGDKMKNGLMITDRECFLNNLFIGLQKVSKEILVKRATEYDGIEAYLYFRETEHVGMRFVKITPDLVDSIGLDTEEIWETAKANTFAETELISLKALKVTSEPLYVIGNRSKIRGASAILNRDILRKLAKQYSVSKLVVLPSSIHEMIVTPYDTSIDMNRMSKMVRDINHSVVDPLDRLTDKAYLVDAI